MSIIIFLLTLLIYFMKANGLISILRVRRAVQIQRATFRTPSQEIATHPTASENEPWLDAAFGKLKPLERCGPLSPPKFLTHTPIALNVDACLDLIRTTMMSEPVGRTKPLITITRGTATGKTTALEWVLREAHLQWKDTLCVGVTFNHRCPLIDMGSNSYGLNGWEMTYAVGIVARMAVGVFGLSLIEAYAALTNTSVFEQLKDRKGLPDARKTVASCVQYFLRKTNKKAFFLCVDEALAAEEAIWRAFPPSQEVRTQWKSIVPMKSHHDALQILRQVLLNSDVPSPNCALVVSSLEKIELTDSHQTIRPLPIPERLAPDEVLSKWWLVDCSENDSPFRDNELSLEELKTQKPRKIIYKPADLTSELTLLLLAAISDSLPRGLEHMKEQLDQEMETVPEGPDGLKRIVMDKEKVTRILHFAADNFRQRGRVHAIEEPSPSVLVAWLFRKKVQLEDVYKLVRMSAFTNRIEDDAPLLLESCILSLMDMFGGGTSSMLKPDFYIKQLVNDLMNVCGAVSAELHHGEPVQEGTPLEVSTMRILQIKLAAMAADLANEGRYISVQELFYPDWFYQAASAPEADRNTVFSAHVSLPESTSFSAIEFELQCCLNARSPRRFFEELNGIDLTDCRFQVLRAAPGDCFDVGLLFIDHSTGKVCLWLGDMQSAREDSSISELPKSGTFSDGKKERAVKKGLNKISRFVEKKKADKDFAVSAAGKALLEGRVLLSYVSTRRGPGCFIAGDHTRCDVTVVGRDVARIFLTDAVFSYYSVFRSVSTPATKSPPAEVQ